MNKIITLAALAFALPTSFAANAQSAQGSETTDVVGSADLVPLAKDKQFSIGITSYAFVIDSDNSGDDTFEGFAISGDYVISDRFALRAAIYSLEHEDFSELEVTGFEMIGYLGTGLMSQGFKAYIGLGLYSETLEGPYGFEEDFSGGQINGGIGYNWESVALDFSIGIRSTGDYEDLSDDGDDLTAATGALTFAYRF